MSFMDIFDCPTVAIPVERPASGIKCEAVEPEYKTCTKCDVSQILGNFYPAKLGKYKRSSDCRTCRAAYYKDRHANVPGVREAADASRIRQLYGITPTDVETMRMAQANACPICSREFGPSLRMNIDHNHSTGAVRALLCNPCNTAIGSMQEDPGVLRAAAAYLEVHRSPQLTT